LSIGESTDGKPLLKCHAGCSQAAVIAALQERGIWPRANGITVAELAAAKRLPETLMRESGFADDELGGRPVIRMDYRGADGGLICVRYRGALAGNGTNQRFWFRRGDKQQLYGAWRLRPAPVIVVEGETDCIALWAEGFNAVGVPGADAWRDDRFAPLLGGCPTVYVHLEPDAGGGKLRAAFLRSRLRDRVRFFTVAPSAKDPCALRARDPDAFRAAVEQALADAQSAPAANECASQMSQVSQSQPVPLVRPVAAAAPYPIDALGPILGPAARAVMEHVQVPDALAAHAVLSCAALAAQPHADVQTLGGPKPLSLFMLTIAESGERKTAADTLASTPVQERRVMLHTQYKAALREYEAAHQGHLMRVRKAKEDAENADDLTRTLMEIQAQPPPRKPFYIVSEPTAEGLVISLRDGQFSQALATDEGGQFLGGYAMSEESELRTITLLSRLWDGTPIDRVRATDKEHTTLFGRRLAVHLMVQPEVAGRLLGKSLYRGQGLLARFLICAPTSRIGTRIHDGGAADPRRDERLRKYWHAVRQLLELQPNEDHEVGGLSPPCTALSAEARELLVRSYNDIEVAMRDDAELAGVREFASKAAEHACRIAGVLTLIKDPSAISVSVDTMHSALQLVQAYIRDYIRLGDAASVSVEVGNAVKLLEWIKRKKLDKVTARNVMQRGPYAIREAPIAKAALRLLQEYGWLLTEDGSHYTVSAHVTDDWGS
jgi:hypothetical protein